MRPETKFVLRWNQAVAIAGNIEDKLREQIASGALVHREMTHTERAKWAKQRSALDAKLTPAERTRRDAILRERRRRTDHTLARGFERTT